MSDTTTKRMLDAYFQGSAVMMFLSSFFKSPARNFHNSEEVEIDIVRSEEEISIAIQDLSVGYRMNSNDIYTNKSFKPPIHKEAIPLNSHDLLKRMAGKNPFEDPMFRADVLERFFSGMLKIEAKIRRAIEQQSSQVLQTGTVTLVDSNGVALYTIDYKPKATHFPTAAIAWDQATSVKIDNLIALNRVILTDGQSKVRDYIMGEDAFEAFISDEAVAARFDNRRFELGGIGPMREDVGGGEFRGIVEVGNTKVNVWTYAAQYKHPQTGTVVPFVDVGKVIAIAANARLDATFGAIPNIGRLLGAQSTNLIPELPGRMMSAANGMDMHTNVWLSNDGEQLFGGIGTRPLMIPTAIDGIGCLDTGI